MTKLSSTLLLALLIAPSAVAANTFDLLLNSERLSYNRGDFQQAIDIGDQALGLSPESFDARYLKAGSLVQLGRFDEALEQYRRCRPHAKTPELGHEVDAAIAQLQNIHQTIQAQPPAANGIAITHGVTAPTNDPATDDEIQRLIFERDRKVAEINARDFAEAQKARDERAAYQDQVTSSVVYDSALRKSMMREYDADVKSRKSGAGSMNGDHVLEIYRYYDKQINDLRMKNAPNHQSVRNWATPGTP